MSADWRSQYAQLNRALAASKASSVSRVFGILAEPTPSEIAKTNDVDFLLSITNRLIHTGYLSRAETLLKYVTAKHSVWRKHSPHENDVLRRRVAIERVWKVAQDAVARSSGFIHGERTARISAATVLLKDGRMHEACDMIESIPLDSDTSLLHVAEVYFARGVVGLLRRQDTSAYKNLTAAQYIFVCAGSMPTPCFRSDIAQNCQTALPVLTQPSDFLELMSFSEGQCRQFRKEVLLGMRGIQKYMFSVVRKGVSPPLEESHVLPTF
jgi:hypothetical protein